MRTGNRVFVSSTVFDLIDVRAEIEEHLRISGLSPIMSDRSLSEFAIDGRSDSIEICLTNVRSADAFVCVLSRRYGSRLGGCGFANLSATHLEYVEAKNEGLPIYFFVRDRLEADYRTWCANGRPDAASQRFRWIGPKDFGLFEQLDEHQRLMAKSTTTNWLSIFTSSIDLKLQLTHRLATISGAAVLRTLMNSGQLPVIVVTAATNQLSGRPENVQFGLSNWGNVAALNVELTMQDQHPIDMGHWPARHITHQDAVGTDGGWFAVEYSLHSGHRIAEEYRLTMQGSPYQVEHVARRYLRGDSFQVLGPRD